MKLAKSSLKVDFYFHNLKVEGRLHHVEVCRPVTAVSTLTAIIRSYSFADSEKTRLVLQQKVKSEVLYFHSTKYLGTKGLSSSEMYVKFTI